MSEISNDTEQKKPLDEIELDAVAGGYSYWNVTRRIYCRKCNYTYAIITSDRSTNNELYEMYRKEKCPQCHSILGPYYEDTEQK